MRHFRRCLYQAPSHSVKIVTSPSISFSLCAALMPSLSQFASLFRSTKRLSRAVSPPELFNHNLRIGSLGRAGHLDAARQLFDGMPTHDIISWNAILTAHWQNSDLEGSKQLFDSMPERNIVSWNSIISGCLENGKPDEALDYFARMPRRNVASWNAMISGLIKYHRFDEAQRLFEEMPVRNVISYTAMVDGLAREGEVDRARDLFDRMPKRNAVSWAAMISGCVENGRFLEARSLFDQMPEKNLAAITAIITGYCKEGRVETARCIFDGIAHKDLICWNAMMAGYVHNEHGEEALKLHIQMLEAGMKPDHATLINVVTACSDLGSLQRGKQTHAYSIKTKFYLYVPLCNALVTMYNKCGSIHDSEFLFQDIQNKDIVSWNAIIAACSQHGHYEKVLSLFNEMEAQGMTPNDITFLSVLAACGYVAKVEESLNWFNLMTSNYGIHPRAEHYACIIDILCRTGHLEKACKYIREMPFESDVSAWSALLAACQLNSHIELGELVAKKLVLLDSGNSGAYVMLSNVYAAAGKWREVTKVRGLMKQNGVKKQPGYSWTEIYNKIHFFVVGEASHPDIHKIISELERIGFHIKMVDHELDLSL